MTNKPFDKDSLVLASASPRRAQLLDQIGVAFTTQSADIDESIIANEGPADYVERLANSKAREIALRITQQAFVLGADTVVVVDAEVLGKPEGPQAAAAMLAKLSGREHQVLTGVALVESPGAKHIHSFIVTTTVCFRSLTTAEINAYVSCGEPLDKAGGYGIQGLGGALVKSITGSYSNVVGLPLAETYELLRGVGYATGLSVTV